MTARKKNAFTLIELLSSIALITILLGILIAAIGRVQREARKSVSSSNIRQIVLSMHLYATSNNGYLPYQMDPDNNRDWSGILVDEELLPEGEVFQSPEDNFTRRFEGQVRSYAINSSKWTYLENGYKSPWPKDRQAKPSKASLIPPNIILVAENFGGAADNTGANVGVAEFEGLDALTRDFYDEQGAFYGLADASVIFKSSAEMNEYRADTDYAGNPLDPWKWKN
ncbi:prepilin-type N-terminal cleavage/methylation domain-containing protein [Coraliomargarita sp. SDUM461003]|uniref:Prepilin-type N-terminal cleavage/methylation domain-containing protein n=1 Tax=Thalassobacterium maritimum TaxID=3041265 RepID=A0ABU1AV67_9BACT|nr:prepilin-type N-terminal cleavage/methylation domain-containing protein [Coraliomargarita sp. SDUM461003]MDQ8208045.1 prepilin-type N-terminal cleavage/methylation domain-containing protein [Coraliomargarita sp. SDUM461003]